MHLEIPFLLLQRKWNKVLTGGKLLSQVNIYYGGGIRMEQKNTDVKVPLISKIAYGMGDVGCNFS